MRKILAPEKVMAPAQDAIKSFYPDIVAEAEAAVQSNAFVIIGMGQNPVVKKAQRLLENQQIPYKLISHGNYFSMWKPRLALKLWSGWPTFPMVFKDGQLLGGAAELQAYLKNKN